MIDIKGHQFMTLFDPIYVNGKRVVKIYANGEQVYPCSPSRMTVTTPPNKTVYSCGETIDYTGIICTLCNSDGSVYKSVNYPNGVIPFEELTFPVSEVAQDGMPESGAIAHTIDGVSFSAYTMECTIRTSDKGYWSYNESLWIQPYNTDSNPWGLKKYLASRFEEAIYCVTIFDGELYIYRATDGDDVYGHDVVRLVNFDAWWWDTIGHACTQVWAKMNIGNIDSFGAYSGIPISGSEPPAGTSSLDIDSLLVPVRWKNTFGSGPEYLEDYVTITIDK